MNTLHQAKAEAEALCRSGDAKAIYLFGSIARNEIGIDIDLVLVVTEEEADDFIECLRYSEDDPYLRRESRREVAERIIGPFGLERATAPNLDVFLFPPNWLGRLEELQERLPHKDPNFMSKIARDARLYNQKFGVFEPARSAVEV